MHNIDMHKDMQKSIMIDFENLLAALPCHVYWLNKDNVYVGCNNQQAEFLLLKNRYEIAGKRNIDLTCLDEETISIWDKNNLQVLKTGKPVIAEEPAVTKQGVKQVVVSHKWPLFDAEKNVIGLLGLSYDITEIKEKELILRKTIDTVDLPLDDIISNMPGHVYWKNKDGIYLGCNDLQAQTLGFQFGKDIIGKSDFDLPWNRQAEVYRENDLRIMETGMRETVEEVANVNDTKIMFLSNKTCLKNKKGDVVGVLGISFDITKQKEAETKLQIAKEQAESANKLKSEFIRNMEHDIRTPFSGILGMAELLGIDEKDPVKKQIILDISHCAQELMNYCCSILDFSRIEAGGLPVSSEQFNLHQLIENIYNIELPAARVKGLNFETPIDGDVPKIIVGDQYRLKRILINLLGNAIKFTNEGYVRLLIKLVKKTQKNIVLNLIVEDSGIGIPAEKVDTIYEKFSRLIPANQGLYKGQGLGLRIVKQFVEEMKGAITIDSTLGKGTCFTCTFSFGLPSIEKRTEHLMDEGEICED